MNPTTCQFCSQEITLNSIGTWTHRLGTPYPSVTCSSPDGALHVGTPVCSHDLDSIVGYEVRETIRSGEVLGLEGPVVATFGSSTLYAEAVAKAYEYRVPRSWAVVDNRYDCGCSSREVIAGSVER